MPTQPGLRDAGVRSVPGQVRLPDLGVGYLPTVHGPRRVGETRQPQRGQDLGQHRGVDAVEQDPTGVGEGAGDSAGRQNPFREPHEDRVSRVVDRVGRLHPGVQEEIDDVEGTVPLRAFSQLAHRQLPDGTNGTFTRSFRQGFPPRRHGQGAQVVVRHQRRLTGRVADDHLERVQCGPTDHGDDHDRTRPWGTGAELRGPQRQVAVVGAHGLGHQDVDVPQEFVEERQVPFGEFVDGRNPHRAHGRVVLVQQDPQRLGLTVPVDDHERAAVVLGDFPQAVERPVVHLPPGGARPCVPWFHRPVPLRVAVLAPSRHPIVEPYAGGMESLVGNLVDGLRHRGHEVLLFAADGSPDAEPELLAGGQWRPDELSAADASMPAQGFLLEHHAHLRVLTALRTTYAGRIDVVHNHSLHYLPLALAETLPVPVVTTLHTPPTPWLTSALAAGGTSRAFTCVSEFTAAQWGPWLPGARVVRNGVDPGRWSLGPGGDGLLWCGRLVPEKAPHLAIDAVRLAGRHLDLVGPVADPGYFSAQIAPRLGASATYRGHLGGAELARVVGRADALLVTPVWDEPFGLVAAEAAMSGTPVIAFDRGGLREFLRPHLGVVVAGEDVSAMASAIPAALTSDRGAVRRCAERTLSFDRTVEGYEEVLHSVTRPHLDVVAS